MEGGEVHHDSFVLFLQPGASLFSSGQRLVFHAAYFRHQGTEFVVVMRAEVVHDVMQGLLFRLCFDVFSKDLTERVRRVIGRASAKYFSGFHSQKCHEIDCAVAFVVKSFVVNGVGIDIGR